MNQRWRVAVTLILAWTGVSTATGNDECVPACSRAEVYIFRGVVGYWPHVSELVDRMSSRGYCPHVHCSCEVPSLTSAVVTQQGERGPIYLIGYSYGASAAVRMARDLLAQGIFVDRMFLIECYDHPEIPPNVRYCVNIYESRPLDRLTPFRGTPALAVDPSATKLIDIDIACDPQWQDTRKNNHFTMADDPEVQEFAAQQFPDLTQQVSSQIPAIESGPVFQQLTVVPTVGAPELQTRGPAAGFQNSNYRAMRPELWGIPRSSAYTTYRVPVIR